MLWQLGSPGASLRRAEWMEMGVVALSPHGFEACLKAESCAEALLGRGSVLCCASRSAAPTVGCQPHSPPGPKPVENQLCVGGPPQRSAHPLPLCPQ